MLEGVAAGVLEAFVSVGLEVFDSPPPVGAASLEPDAFASPEAGGFEVSDASGLLVLLELLESVL